nr:arif [Dasychira pudibunda nucleopolyhedrovirus]
MLVQINYFLQLVLHAALFGFCSFAFVFALMGTVTARYAFLLELEDSAHSIINLSHLAAFLLAPYVLATITWAMYKMLLCYKGLEMRSNFYMKTVVALAHLMAVSCWLLFVVFQPQIHKNGHVPVLDALIRHHDRQSLCWSGVVVQEYEVHDANAIRTDLNCVYYDNFIKKCVGCRVEVRHDEPTVFNQNQGALTMLALLAIVMHCWNMYVQQKETRRKPNRARNITNTLLMETEKEYDTAEEEEHESNMRMLDIISEARQEQAPQLFSFLQADGADTERLPINFSTQAACPPSSPDSGISAGHYDVPTSVYRVPKPKIKIPVPPPMPVAPIIARSPRPVLKFNFNN